MRTDASFWITCYLAAGFLWASWNAFGRAGRAFSERYCGRQPYDFVFLVGFLSSMLCWPLFAIFAVYIVWRIRREHERHRAFMKSDEIGEDLRELRENLKRLSEERRRDGEKREK